MGLAGIGAGLSLLGKPVNSNSLPADATTLQTQLVDNNGQLTQTQSLITQNSQLQAQFQKEYQAALISGGQDAANAVGQKYAGIGYTDPSKLTETASTLQNNSDILTAKLSQSQSISQSNPYLSSDQDTSGPVDSKANLNTAVNADSNISEQPVVVAAADVPSSNEWSI